MYEVWDKIRAMDHLGLNQKTMEAIISIAQQYRVEKVLLFGSRARGDYHRTSDIVNLDGSVQKELLQSIEKEGIIIYEKV